MGNLVKNIGFIKMYTNQISEVHFLWLIFFSFPRNMVLLLIFPVCITLYSEPSANVMKKL